MDYYYPSFIDEGSENKYLVQGDTVTFFHANCSFWMKF